MNQYKQSKPSIIFQTCWLAGYKGATTEDIFDALDDCGFYMPLEKSLEPVLKTLLRRRQLKNLNDRWCVEKPYTPLL